MWFSNLNIFKITEGSISEECLVNALPNKLFTPCTASDEKSAGWVSPFGDKYDTIVHSVMGGHMVCLKVEEKKIPSDVLNEKLQERIEEIQIQNPEGKISRELKTRLKEEVRLELVPFALPKVKRYFAYVDQTLEYIIVNESSATKSETIINYLVNTLNDDSIKVRAVSTVHDVSAKMSSWVKDEQVPAGIELSTSCKIESEDKNKISYSKHSMDDEKLQSYLREEGFMVTELELVYPEKFRFVLTSDFVIKGIKLEDELKDQIGEEDMETLQQEMDVDFAIMGSTLRDFIPYILETLGGEHIAGSDDQADSDDPENEEPI
jgi:recombination associated protein RdgC